MIAFVSLNDQQPVWGNDGNETRKQMEHELWYLQTRTNTRTHTHTLSLFLSLSLCLPSLRAQRAACHALFYIAGRGEALAQ